MQIKKNSGFGIVEILVAIVLLAIMALAVVQSTMSTIKLRHRNLRNSIAMQLALEQLERFAAIDPENLSDADDFTESVVERNITFSRSIDVTENADGSRTVNVDVLAENTDLGGKANVSNIFSPWGAL